MAKKFNYLLVIAFFLVNTVSVFAQDDDEMPEPPPGAPVNKYILLLGIIGSVFVWKYFTKKRTAL